MFENMSFDYLIKRAISNVPNNVDKRQGSIIYDAIAPCCLEIAKIYESLDNVLNQVFADTSSREFLIRRAEERGLTPKPSSPAIMKGVFNKNVSIGSRFFIDGLIYFVSEKISDCNFKLTCETNGSEGHRHFGTLLPLDNIDGLNKAEITEIIVTGEDEEDTELFRQRYFDSFNALAFGGNKKDYIEKVDTISGVGGCKVFPAFFGPGTVRLVIISSGYSRISTDFAKQIKELADPFEYSSEGVGFAPIGHKVYVESVKERPITIDIQIELLSHADFDFISQKVIECIKNYFYELSKVWADNSYTEIVSMKLGTEIFNINGVKNVSDISIFGEDSFLSFSLEDDEIPILKQISINGTTLEGI